MPFSFMPFLDQELGDLREPMFGSQVQACVASVVKVRVAQVGRVVADDAFDEREVVEENGAAETPGYVNPILR
jgi:hypothetical protein